MRDEMSLGPEEGDAHVPVDLMTTCCPTFTMTTYIDGASALLTGAERSIEIAAQNVANVTTPGYKRQIEFSALTADLASSAGVSTATDFTAGKSMQTGNPYNLSIAGGGFFVVRAPNHVMYTRLGEFHRDADGRLLTPEGCTLQADGGGDVVVRSEDVKILPDGTVLEDGLPTSRLSIVDFPDPRVLTRAWAGMFRADGAVPMSVDTPVVHQGMLEASNVSTGDEMVNMMAALRLAESGQRLINVYDDLMGRALTAFGQG